MRGYKTIYKHQILFICLIECLLSSKIHRMTLMTLGSQKWNGTTLHFTKEPFLFSYICQKHHQPSCSFALWLNARVSTPVLDLNSISFSVTFRQEKIKVGQIVLPYLPIPWSKRKNTDEYNCCIYFSCQLVSVAGWWRKSTAHTLQSINMQE